MVVVGVSAIENLACLRAESSSEDVIGVLVVLLSAEGTYEGVDSPRDRDVEVFLSVTEEGISGAVSLRDRGVEGFEGLDSR